MKRKEERKMSEEIVRYQTESGEVALSPEIVKKYLVSGKPEKVTEEEVMMFLNLCKYQRLNPFIREAYLVKYSDNQPASMVVGKDTLLKRAARNPHFDGLTAGVIVRRGDQITQRIGSLVLDDEDLVGGWAKVYRKDWKAPVEVTVSLREYKKTLPDGRPMANWSSMPATMIRKVALAQALREAFPEDFSQLYAAEEMPVDESQLDETPIAVPYEIRETLEEELLTDDTETVEPDDTTKEVSIKASVKTKDKSTEQLEKMVVHEQNPRPVKASEKASVPKGDTRIATAKQVNYIISLAKKVHGDYYQDYLDEFLDGFGKNKLEELTIAEASKTIEALQMRANIVPKEESQQNTDEIIDETLKKLGDNVKKEDNAEDEDATDIDIPF